MTSRATRTSSSQVQEEHRRSRRCARNRLLGLREGIPINEVSDENLEKVKPVLKKWLPLVKVYDSDSPKTALLNGDVRLGVVWGGRGAILLNEDKKFK